MDKDQLPDRLLERASRLPTASQVDTCLDVETLAAWADGTLSPSERNAAQHPAADCERCLTTLAAMAKTEPPSALAHQPAWRSFRWVVPLATASVALAVWIAVQQVGSPRAPEPEAAVVDQATPVSETAAQPSTRKDAAAAAAPLADAAAPASAPVIVEQRSKRRADDPAMAKALDRVQVVPNEPRQEPKKEAGVSETAGVTATSPPVLAPPARSTSAAARFSAAPHVFVSSPDPTVRWRLSGPSVERSLDGGVTWQRQSTSTDAVLTGGSAPSRTVCWIVGHAGTVLLTTDGEAWRRITFPDPKAHLSSVVATDGTHATVTTADGKTYVTADAGTTWRLQEDSTAPF